MNGFLSYLGDSLVRRDGKSGLYIDQASSEVFSIVTSRCMSQCCSSPFVAGLWREILKLVFHTFWLLNTGETLALRLLQTQTSECY